MTLDSSNDIKTYEVKSQSDPSKKYTVKYFPAGDKWVCTCPSYIFHQENFECKHILKIKKSLEEKKEQYGDIPSESQL
jgi:hypothetical protein